MYKALEYTKSTIGLFTLLGILGIYFLSLSMLSPVITSPEQAQVAGINESTQPVNFYAPVDSDLKVELLSEGLIRVLVPANFTGQTSAFSVTNTSLSNPVSLKAKLVVPAEINQQVYINLASNGKSFRMSGPNSMSNREVLFNLNPNQNSQFDLIINPETQVNYSYSLDIVTAY